MTSETPSAGKFESQNLKALALEAGFDACGIARAEKLKEDEAFFKKWLADGMHGDMHYLERNLEKRLDPQILVPGCKSLIVVLLNYNPTRLQPADAPRVARYAYSEVDYHTVIKEKLAILENKITDIFGKIAIAEGFQHRFVDSAPVFERRWAQKAGLGWIGKHTQLIHPGLGSYVFIGVLMLQMVADQYDTPMNDRCGTCSRCLDACPTRALTDRVLDAKKCISYLTIETKKDIPAEFHHQLSGNIIGCDICAEVCPWNKKWATPHNHKALSPNKNLMMMQKDDWSNLDKSTFNQIFKTSAIQRAGFDKISVNLQIYNQQNNKY